MTSCTLLYEIKCVAFSEAKSLRSYATNLILPFPVIRLVCPSRWIFSSCVPRTGRLRVRRVVRDKELFREP
jgi:hypothetical protein